MAKGDELQRLGRTPEALESYREALQNLEDGEKELCALKMGRCMRLLGDWEKAFGWYKTLSKWKLSPPIRRRISLNLFELSIPRWAWDEHITSLKALMTDPQALNEQGAAVKALANVDMVWKHRSFWEGERFRQVKDLVMTEATVRLPGVFPLDLVRFASMVDRELESRAWLATTLQKGLHTQASSAGGFRYLTDSLYQEGMMDQAEQIRSRAPEWFWNRMQSGEFLKRWNYSTMELEIAYHKSPQNLEEWFAGAASKAAVDIPARAHAAPYALVEVCQFAWGLGHTRLARKLLETLIREFPNSGWAQATARLNLAAIALWAGDQNVGGNEASVILGQWGTETWALPLTRLLAGEWSFEKFNDENLAFNRWNLIEAELATRLAAAAHAKSKGLLEISKNELRLVLGASFAFEPAHRIAERWLGEL